jgi:hypothetical protein
MKTYEQTIKYLAVNMVYQFLDGGYPTRDVRPVPFIYGVLEDRVILDVDAEYEAMINDQDFMDRVQRGEA